VPLANGDFALELPEILLEDFGEDQQGATPAEWWALVLEDLLGRALAAGEEVFPGPWQTLLGDELGPRKALEARGEELLEDLRRDPAGFLEKQERGVKKLRRFLGGGE